MKVLLDGQADVNSKAAVQTVLPYILYIFRETKQGGGAMTALMYAAADDHVDAVQVPGLHSVQLEM